MHVGLGFPSCLLTGILLLSGAASGGERRPRPVRPDSAGPPAPVTTAPAATSAPATTQAASAPATAPAKTIPLSFNRAPMEQIAKFLNEQMGKPVIVDKEAEKIQVTLVNPKPLPVEEAMYILTTALHEAGVAIEERDRTVHLIPIAQVSKAQIRTVGAEVDLTTWKPANEIIRKIFEVRYYDPTKLVDVLKPLLPAWGHVTADPQAGKIIIVCTAERLLTMARIISELDRAGVSGGELRVFTIRNLDVLEIVPMLEKLIGGYLGVEVKAASVTGPEASAGGPRPDGPRMEGRPGGPDRPGGAGEPSAAAMVTVKASRTPVLLIPEPRRSQIVVAAPTNVLDQIKVWIETLDQPKPPSTQTEMVEIKYGDSGELVNQLTSMLAGIPDEGLRSGVKLFPFPSSRRLMIVGSEANRSIIKNWLQEIDIADTGIRVTRTFTLKNADAQQVADNIRELFQERRSWYDDYYGRRSSGEDRTKVTVTPNVRSNSVTVVASPEKMTRIAEQIEEWDKPFEGEEAAPRIYELKYADPEKTRTLLESLFTKKEQDFSWRRFWGEEDTESSPTPVGRLFGQFRFEAYPETGKLIVVSKNEENYKVIEKMIQEIDRPQETGKPRIIQLKFAEAETLAEQLNALLSGPGTPASILRRARAGTFEGFSELRSPYRHGGDSSPQQQRGPQQDGQNNLAEMRFWWQSPSDPTKVKQPSNMVGKLRIVPNVEQNLLMVAAPEEHAEAIEAFVKELDKPGYQVLIKAVIAEVALDDSLSLGYKFSSDPSIFTTGDSLANENTLRGLLTYSWKDAFDDDRHQLAFNIDVINVLSLLKRVTDLKIRSEPKILTADNIEGEFFDGQDIPFVSNSQLTDTGVRNDTFDYFPVGIRLRVRPHITKEKNVDLTVNLLISTVVPGRQLFGGAIVDRRETTTRIVLEDGRTFLISGILREEERAVNRRVPGLGDIPVFGEIFKHRENAKVNTELLVFLTPYVIEAAQGHPVIEQEPLKRLQEHHIPEGEFGGPPGEPVETIQAPVVIEPESRGS